MSKDTAKIVYHNGENRRRPHVNLTLLPSTVERLDEIAARWAVSRSAAVERLVRESEIPRKKQDLGTRTAGEKIDTLSEKK